MKIVKDFVPQHGTNNQLAELGKSIRGSLDAANKHLDQLVALQRKTLDAYWDAGKAVSEAKAILRGDKKRPIAWEKFCNRWGIKQSSADEAEQVFIRCPTKEELPEEMGISELKDRLGIKKYERIKIEDLPEDQIEAEEGDDDELDGEQKAKAELDGQIFLISLGKVEQAVKALARQPLPKTKKAEAAERIEIAQGDLGQILFNLEGKQQPTTFPQNFEIYEPETILQ